MGLSGSAEFCKKLIDAKADPNVPATAQLVTPLEQVMQLISFEEERDDRLNDIDQVNRLDDTALAYRPNLKPPHREVRCSHLRGGQACGDRVRPEDRDLDWHARHGLRRAGGACVLGCRAA